MNIKIGDKLRNKNTGVIYEVIEKASYPRVWRLEPDSDEFVTVNWQEAMISRHFYAVESDTPCEVAND